MSENDTGHRRPITHLMSGDFRVREAGKGGAEEHEGLVVLLDGQGAPSGLVGPDGPGPAVVVPADTPIVAVLHSAEVLEALLDGVAALVVVGDGPGPLGVVSAAALRSRLALEMAAPHRLGDADAYGRRTRLPPPIRIRCAECGGTNVFARISQSRTARCTHGDHDFVPDHGES
jgi:hypothetical protein